MEDPTMEEQTEANIEPETEQNDVDINPDLDPESDKEQELKDEEDKPEPDQEEDGSVEEEQPRCSVSPKVARPKLPEFTGNGRISSHTRSKTDPGRGGEIKAIIDKTMEDIKELNKVDFTIYNRPKVFPKPLHQRSQSTHASPRASPTPSSPSMEEKVSALNRNRSRSLKVLTDMLKSGRGGNDFRSGNIPDVGSDIKSNSDSQLLPRRQRESKESSVERRSSSDGQLQARRQDSSGPVTNQSRVSDARTPDIYSQQKEFGQSERHYSDHSEQKRKGGTLPRYRQESGKFRRAKSEVRKAAPISDDEGLDVTSDHESGGHGLVKPFHSIDTNSQFFALYKTNPSTRRPQFTGFVKTRYKSNSQGEEQGTRPGDQIGSASRKFTRLELTPLTSKNAKSRLSSLRHVTHPPQSQTTFREGGTMDSNGFGTLLKSPSTESPPPFPGEAEKTSDLSLTDSQTGQSDSMDEASYGEQDDQSEAQTESCDNNASDVDTIKPAEKKSNGKTLKQKSKSDPSSDKSQSIDQSELPQLITVSQSTPHLSADSSQDIEEEATPDTTIDTDSQDEDKRGRTLSSRQSFDDEVPLQFDATSSTGGSGSPMSYSIEEEGLLSPDSDGPPPNFVSVMYGVTSAPSTPVNQSPTNTLERTNYLNVPTSVTISSTSNNKKSIGRSASSASVLHRERKFSGGSKDKENIRKHSVTIGDDSAATPKPELFPLGDSSGMQALSMPSMTSTWKKERGPSMSPERDQSLVKDKRYHIVEEFYHNEKEYVEALQKLKDKYMTPLKVSSNIDEAIVDNIFYMIPEILTHHTIYLDFLENVWAKWDTKTSTIGNIIIGIFSKQTVVDSYLSFVENYRTSGKVIENALQTKSSVQKFIEQCQRDSGSKLSMKDLIVRPIQRIPRYELLIQRLIENTPHDHPDFPLLKEAERVMHNFAIKLGTNENQLEEDQQSTLKKLELLVPDMSPLVAPDRQYLKHDMVQILTKKDQCCIWIFSDLVIFSSVKRRGGPVTRKVSVILKSPTGNEYAENIKHKVWLRVGLDNIEIVKSQLPPVKKSSLDPDQLEEDINILTEMSEMTNKLNYPHSSLDDVVKEMLASLNKQLSEVSIRSASLESNKMEILVTTQEGVYPLEICFSSAEKRAIWESTLMDAKQKLSLLSDKRAPEFQQPLQITKTRAGMQFSCAAPIDGLNNSGYRDVWVCNSDGYVGHMCLLSLQPEPIVTLNTPVPGCNARILCICAVPAYSGPFRRKSSSKKNLHKHTVPPVAEDSPEINIEEVDDVSEPEEDAASAGYQTDSESSEEEEEEEMEEEVEGEKEVEGEETQQEKEEGSSETVFDNKPKDLYLGDSSEGKASPVSQLINLDPFTMTGNWLQDAHKSTMWLGTEDGCIHIFQCTDNIKTTKNKLKIHHGSPVYCIVYLDNKVFVSLANGDLIVYKRDSDGIWDTENPYTRTVGSVISPISRMLAVAGKLWCGCQNVMNVINPLTLRIETTFQVTTDSSRCIQCLVCAGQGVWLASQHSSKISLYHATSFEPLLEVNIAHSVAQKLQSADDIIRQHKAACLRITALLVCKDLLWVGTSAGVILTIPMPRITSTSTRGSISTPSVTGLVFGHTGHVRFLTCVELTAPSSPTTPKAQTEDEETDDKPDNLAIHDIHRRSSMAATTATMATRMLVISGGDGYEDFRNNSTNEVAGRDDSTNHLLLWQV